MRPNPLETADLLTFTEEIFNGKLFAFCVVLDVCMYWFLCSQQRRRWGKPT